MIVPRSSGTAWLHGMVFIAACAVGTGITPAIPAKGFDEAVEQAAIQAASDHVSAPDRLEVLSASFAGADPADGATVRLELADVAGPNASGVLRVRFRTIVNGRPEGEARATVRGRIIGPGLAATRTLRRGDPIEPSDVELMQSDLTRLIEAPLREPALAVGLVPVRTLGRGRLLTADLLAPAPVVYQGDTVDLRIERDRMSVTAVGRALRSGAPGEIVPAENRATGVRVQGIVQPDGSLVVVKHSRERRF